MNKIFLIPALLLVAFALSLTPPCNKQLLAVSGCCKDRASLKDPWKKNGMNFRECERLNQKIDGDNVFDQRGRVWWDSGC